MKISIPEPCKKSWSGMTPSGNGRYCGSCEKVVVDFTKMNDDEIKHYFLNSNERVCGHFHMEQLDEQSFGKTTRLVLNWYRKAESGIKYRMPRMAAIFVLGLALSLMACTTGVTEEPVGKVQMTGDSIALPVDSGKVALPAASDPTAIKDSLKK